MQFRDRQPMFALSCGRRLTRIPRDAGDRRGRSPGLGVALLSLVVLTVAACGSSATDSDPAVDSTPTATEAGSATATTPTTTPTDMVEGPSATSSEPTAVDSCTLLSDEEAAQFLGGPVVSSGPTSGVGESVCQWANEQGWSIDVSVGSSGTAPGNSFTPENLFGVEPTPIPELDGAGWDIGLGTVDFAAGERHNSVLVVSSTSSDTNAQTAAAVAVLLRDRIEATS